VINKNNITISSLLNKENVTKDGVIYWWIWSGKINEEKIKCDIDYFNYLGIKQVLIAAGYGVEPMYLSDQWFEMVKLAVELAYKNSIKIWIADEGTYPSGFAGGKFTTTYPKHRMKAIVIDRKFDFDQSILHMDLSDDIVGILLENSETNEAISYVNENKKLEIPLKEGKWKVSIIKEVYLTSPTRYVHHPKGAKDTTYSLCDYLDTDAVEIFIKEVHEKYKDYLYKYFGQTVLGFFGDEPDYSINGIPWTPKIYDEFYNKKGYDIKPYIPLFFSSDISEQIKRAKADYWDVWSDLFTNFFKMQSEWCQKHGISYMVHLNHEDLMMDLTKSEGDFFKCMKYVQFPGVDVIWRQIWMDKNADFPKYASSVAHILNIPKVFSESFAVYGKGLSIEQAKWVIDYQMARGINCFLTSFFNEKNNPQYEFFPDLIEYINNSCNILSKGKPYVKTLLYFPSLSMFCNDEYAYEKTLEISNLLLENQIDFDFINDYLLSSNDYSKEQLINSLIENYSLIILPPTKYISRKMLDFLNMFSNKGNMVIVADQYSKYIVDKSFIDATFFDKNLCYDFKIANIEQIIEIINSKNIYFSPKSNSINITMREFDDGYVLFLFNKSKNPYLGTIKINFDFSPYIMDSNFELIKINKLNVKKYTAFNLYLEPYESKFIILSNHLESTKTYEIILPEKEILDLSENWEIIINNNKFSGKLYDWSYYGFEDFSGKAIYRKDFTINKDALENSYIYLECPNIHYSAKLRINGIDLEKKANRPFKWDVKKYLKEGKNTIEFEVQNTLASNFWGNKEKQAELMKQAQNNFYLRIFKSFDEEMLKSGLLPPVKLMSYNLYKME